MEMVLVSQALVMEVSMRWDRLWSVGVLLKLRRNVGVLCGDELVVVEGKEFVVKVGLAW